MCMDGWVVVGCVCVVWGRGWGCCCLHSIWRLFGKRMKMISMQNCECQIVEKLQHRYANNNNRSTHRSPSLQNTTTHTIHTNTVCQRRIFNNNFSALLCEISFYFHSFLHLFFVHRHIAHSHQVRNEMRCFRHRLTNLFYFFVVVYFAFVIHFEAIIVFKQRFC